jgi:hypothetical protein
MPTSVAEVKVSFNVAITLEGQFPTGILLAQQARAEAVLNKVTADSVPFLKSQNIVVLSLVGYTSGQPQPALQLPVSAKSVQSANSIVTDTDTDTDATLAVKRGHENDTVAVVTREDRILSGSDNTTSYYDTIIAKFGVTLILRDKRFAGPTDAVNQAVADVNVSVITGTYTRALLALDSGLFGTVTGARVSHPSNVVSIILRSALPSSRPSDMPSFKPTPFIHVAPAAWYHVLASGLGQYYYIIIVLGMLGFAAGGYWFYKRYRQYKVKKQLMDINDLGEV